MARRRQGDSEDSAEKIAISLKLPKKLLNRIDSYWKENSDSFTGRTHFIEEACTFYLTCEKCRKCGRLNTPESRTCSYCGEELDGVEYIEHKNRLIGAMSRYDEYVESILSYKEKYSDLDNKIKWYINKLDDKKKSIAEALLPGYYSQINHVMKTVDWFLEYREMFRELYESGLPFPGHQETLAQKYNKSSMSSDDFISAESVDMFNEYRCFGINYAYYRAKVLLDNLDTANAQDLKTHWLGLYAEGVYLPAILEDVVEGLKLLKNTENMIDVLSEIQTIRPISISRREQQD